MSEELNNSELSTSMVEAGEPVISQDIAPVVEEIAEVEVPAVEEVEQPKEDTITTPRYEQSSEEVQALGSVADGTIGATTTPRAPRKTAPAKSKAKKETVALYSTKNVSWGGVGKLYRGYNIVSKEEADKWLTRDHVRVATPDEVAKAYGK
jgi:hypothetical protein